VCCVELGSFLFKLVLQGCVCARLVGICVFEGQALYTRVQLHMRIYVYVQAACGVMCVCVCVACRLSGFVLCINGFVFH